MLLVLAAMPEESAPLLDRMEDCASVPCPLRSVSAARGTLAGTDTLVVTTGIGIAAASAAATWAGVAHSPALAVAAGSCGGLAADVEVGTLIIGDSFTWSLADATAFGYAPGQLPGGPLEHRPDAEALARAQRAAAASGAQTRTGQMLSGDAFVTADLAPAMRERFPAALSADMETTASARACEELGVPFTALRAVSDLCGPAAGQQFHLELDVVAQTSAQAVEELARELRG